jgi:hypothetical protein
VRAKYIVAERIARPGQGKSGGFRAMIVYRRATRAVFVHGFAKNDRTNVTPDELAALKELASEILAYDDKRLARVVSFGTLIEVMCHEEE